MSVARLVIAPVADGADAREAIIRRAVRRGFTTLLLPAAQSHGRSEVGVEVVEGHPDRIVTAAHRDGIALVSVRSPTDAEPALRSLRAGRPVAVRWLEERVIPLENLVAARSAADTLWVVTDRVQDVPAFLGALEHGADHVVVEVRSVEELDRLESVIEPGTLALTWAQYPVHRVAPAGMGDRVIVDTTSLLAADEGLLVGSQAAVLLHVASEAVGSRYTRPRPFRVNAGAAHLYTLLANGETRYLSELVAGDSVVVARPGEPPRAVTVGRIKIERRPLVLIEVGHGERRYTAFLQEAETVRVTTTTGGRVATTDLAAGATIRGVELPPARHLGTAVLETIEER